MARATFGASLLLAGLLGCSGSHDDSPAPAAATPTVGQQTVDLPSAAQPAQTPGTPGVTVTNTRLLEQFADQPVDLNRARYTRYYLEAAGQGQPDSILVLIPGFEGGASTFTVLAENLVTRASEDYGLRLEVWAFDRRSNMLEDTVGLDIAEQSSDPLVGLDFLFGGELGLELHPALAEGPGRRAIFHGNGTDLAFMAQWTPLVHSLDIDTVIEAALAQARNGNVFLGGHSAGTGYTARYAATDFDFDSPAVTPGYAKLRGLVLLEGGGGSIPATPPSADQLDTIEAQFDGGLFDAVNSQRPVCSDGLTACTAATQAVDCAAFSNPECSPYPAYADGGGLLSPQLFAVSEVNALDASQVGDGVQSLLQRDFGAEGNNAIAQVPQLAGLTLLVGDQPASSANLLGQFLDDDGVVAGIASFVATSLGAPGVAQDGIATWASRGEDIPASAFTDRGPPPTLIANERGGNRWGLEVEASDLEGRMLPIFYRGQTNFSDWYYPSSGLAIGDELGLDTTALSAPPPAGRGRTDIANRTEAGNIDIPVIAFGGSNGLTPIPANWLGFADAIGPCNTASCDGSPRILDRQNPSAAFPTFGGIGGGFEVYISEGYAHVDIVTAEDDTSNEVVGPLLEFLLRNQLR